MTPFRKIILVVGGTILAATFIFFLYSAFRDEADLAVGQITVDAPEYPQGSIPYSLPMKGLVITTTTKITGCLDTISGEEIHGYADLAITDLITIDSNRRYYIYYSSGSRGKDLSYAVENFENGTLKSVSTSIHDQVAPITAAVIGSLLKLVPALPPAPPAPPPPPTPPPSNCQNLQIAATRRGDDERLKIRQENIWTPNEIDRSKLIYTDLSSLQREFKLSNPHWFRANAFLSVNTPEGIKRNSARPDIIFSPGECIDQSCQVKKPSLAKGLILRDAVAVQLMSYVCDSRCDKLRNVKPMYESDTQGLTQYPSVEKILPQFGNMFLLPVHSGYAQDSSVNVTLTADGLITKLQIETKSSLAANITAIGSNAGTVSSALTSAETTITRANKNLSDCLAAQKAVLANGGVPIGTCH